MARYRERWIAKAFIGPQANSFGALSVSSNFSGHAAIRGIAIIESGTTVVSIAATGIVSGDVIIAQPIQYTNVRDAIVAGSNSGVLAAMMVTVPVSVGGGRFLIVTAGSVAPTANMPVAWFKIN